MSDNQSELREQIRSIITAPMRSEISTADMAVVMSSTSLGEKVHDLVALIEAREKQVIRIGDDVDYNGKTYEVVGLSTMKNNHDGEPEWTITHDIQEVAIADKYDGVTYQKPAWLTIEQLTHPSSKEEVTNE